MAASVPLDVTFVSFFETEHARLYRAMLLLGRGHAEAEDLAQEAMVRVYERWDRVRTMASPAGYLYKTAFNLNRKRSRRLRRESELPMNEPSVESVSGVETRVDVLRALQSLPRRQREVVVLSEYLAIGSEEAGRLLGIKAASVRSRLHEARRALQLRLGGIP
ncbi:MAG: sigma-70 family RNA polymerase sigma factor [Actinobacteria bacterium]|nr:sigma-70 family RNA polymerase sigma factor [Actinomycetota bacterium]